MKLATYLSDDGPRLAGVNSSGALVDLNRTDRALPSSMRDFLAQPGEMHAAAQQAIDRGKALATTTEIRLLAPVPDAQKILCVGLNYADHAREVGIQPGDEPVIFNKLPTTLRGDGESIVLPGASDQVDYEAELVVVVGQGGKHLTREQAFDAVAGYTCGHDVSARDWQKGKPGRQWLLGKSFDSFAPCGPYLVTADEIPNPDQLDIIFRLNGSVMQSSNTRRLIFPIDYLVSYLSNVMTLLPGDLIFTGTPPGVGMARPEPVFLQAGDLAEVSIESIGTLRNPVAAENPS